MSKQSEETFPAIWQRLFWSSFVPLGAADLGVGVVGNLDG